MNLDELSTQIQTVFGDRLRDLRKPSSKRWNLFVEPSDIVDAADILHNQLGSRLQTATAVDEPRTMEIIYHWAFDSLGLIVNVRTRIDREPAEIDSITTVCPSAQWIEQEMWELMGINFTGHPGLRHLLLDDDWPADKYPLRRDYRRD